ncbi:MAG: hypothetical protein EXR75_01765 [Myxococcales bacterium]|nr:hypothetical protein [Myxococcales bacterium]
MSFAQFNAPGQRLLGNALYLPPDDPVRILVYRKFANAGAAGNVDAILAAEGALRGRSFIVKTRDTAAALGSDLSGGTYDVLLIHDQPSAPNGQMQSLGSALQGAISSFAQAGGTVVVLASATGEMSAFLTSSGILATTALTDATGAAILGVVPNDVVAVGVLSPFLAKPATATIGSSEPSGPLLTHVFVHKASMAPIVIHKIVLK